MCYSTQSWFDALEELARDKTKRIKIGQQGYEDWFCGYTHSILNSKFSKFLANLVANKNIIIR
jgi:hypothetical protein